MTLKESIAETIETLTVDDQQKVLEFAETLKNEKQINGKQPRKNLKGLWAGRGIDISEEDIAEIRREMWGNFPREDI